jgi:hypothetical protein
LQLQRCVRTAVSIMVRSGNMNYSRRRGKNVIEGIYLGIH